MAGWLAAASVVDRITRFFSIIASILVLASCVISAGNALSRYAFDISSNAWLEIQWQMFAGIFMLGAAHVLKLNEHVRVDILYSGYSARTRLWVDIFGLIFFLFPVTILMIRLSIPWFETSFLEREMSSNAGGLPIWPVKALLPLGFTLLMMQGIAELVRRIAALKGDIAINVEYEAPLQ